MERTDEELLAAWADGDKEAAGALFHRHFGRLYRFFELSAPGQAEDLLQDTMLAALQSRSRYRGSARFAAYLMGIARNKVLMYWRSKARKQPHQDIEHLSLAALEASPSTVLARRREAQRLLAALQEISISAQMLLQMHYWDTMTGPELAAALEVPEGTVRSRLRAAKAELRSTMERTGPLPDELADEAAFDRWVASLKREVESE